MKQIIFLFIFAFMLMCVGVFFFEKYDLHSVKPVISVKAKDEQVEGGLVNTFERKDASQALADASLSEQADELEKKPSPPLPIFLTEATTPLAIYLTEFLEQNKIGYLDTSRYPFSNDINSHIKEYLQSQEYILIDNTNAEMWEGLDQRFDDVTPSKAVAKLFGIGVVDDENPVLAVVSSFIDPKTNSVKRMMIEVEPGSTNQKTEATLKELLVYLEEHKRQVAEGEFGLEGAQNVPLEDEIIEDEIIEDEIIEDEIIEGEIIEDEI